MTGASKKRKDTGKKAASKKKAKKVEEASDALDSEEELSSQEKLPDESEETDEEEMKPKRIAKTEIAPKKRKAHESSCGNQQAEKDGKKPKVERAHKASKRSKKEEDDGENKTFSTAARALGLPEAIGAGPTRPKRSRKDEKVSKSEVKKKKNEKKVKAEVEDGEKSEGEETLVMGGDGDDDAEVPERAPAGSRKPKAGSLMDSYQTFLKAELQTLAQKHPEKSGRERLKMARDAWRTHPDRMKTINTMSRGQLSRRRLKVHVSNPELEDDKKIEDN